MIGFVRLSEEPFLSRCPTGNNTTLADWLRIDDGDRTAATWAYTQQAERVKAMHGTRLTVSEV